TAVAYLYVLCNKYPESLSASERAVVLARLAGEDAVLIEALLQYIVALFATGRFEEVIQATPELLPLAERVGDPWYLSGVLKDLTLYSSTIQGAFAQSRAYYDRAIELGEQVGDPISVFASLYFRGNLNFNQGDWQAARADYERARALHLWKKEHPLS